MSTSWAIWLTYMFAAPSGAVIYRFIWGRPHRHDWKRWQPIRVRHNGSHGQTTGFSSMQTRACRTCGFEQLKAITP